MARTASDGRDGTRCGLTAEHPCAAMAASISSPKGVMVAGVRFGSPPPGRRASERDAVAAAPGRMTHATGHGRELGESWMRGHSLPNHGATIPSGSLSTMLGDNAPATWHALHHQNGRQTSCCRGCGWAHSRYLTLSGCRPSSAGAKLRSKELSEAQRGEFGSVLVQSSDAVLLGDEEHKELLGDLPPAMSAARISFSQSSRPRRQRRCCAPKASCLTMQQWTSTLLYSM